MTGRLAAVYLLETPLAPERAAEVLAGEQSCGTFVKVKGETHAHARRSTRSKRSNRSRHRVSPVRGSSGSVRRVLVAAPA